MTCLLESAGPVIGLLPSFQLQVKSFQFSRTTSFSNSFWYCPFQEKHGSETDDLKFLEVCDHGKDDIATDQKLLS